jgi:hypothetical protein
MPSQESKFSFDVSKFMCCFGVQLVPSKIEEVNMFTCWKGMLP